MVIKDDLSGSIEGGRFDLGALRQQQKKNFIAWDQAVDSKEQLVANSIRLKISCAVRIYLKSLNVARKPGLYLFTDGECQDFRGSPHYVGLAENSLSERIQQHLKHTSVLDMNLMGRPEEELKPIIFRRLKGAMGKSDEKPKGSTDEILDGYTDDHARAAHEKTGTVLFLAGFPEEHSHLIKTVESLLIASMWLKGFPMTNRIVSSLCHPSELDAGFEVASQTIKAWEKAGLPSEWAAVLSHTLSVLRDP